MKWKQWLTGKRLFRRHINGFPNLIVSDVMMPVSDGFELLKALRADAQTRTIPVILLSARAGEESRVEGIQAGADDYLIKPFSARELLARVSGRLEITRIRRDQELQLRLSHAELEGRVRERTQELLNATYGLRELSARLLQAQDEERRRIARELQDGAGQLLAAIGMEAAALARESDRLTPPAAASLSNIESLVIQMTKDIRTMAHLLYPPCSMILAFTPHLRTTSKGSPHGVGFRYRSIFRTQSSGWIATMSCPCSALSRNASPTFIAIREVRPPLSASFAMTERSSWRFGTKDGACQPNDCQKFSRQVRVSGSAACENVFSNSLGE
jgi:CheY-like chemotaxis protein